jgi:hypothetical protein
VTLLVRVVEAAAGEQTGVNAGKRRRDAGPSVIPGRDSPKPYLGELRVLVGVVLGLGSDEVEDATHLGRSVRGSLQTRTDNQEARTSGFVRVCRKILCELNRTG